ncbi:BQ2448_7540 [Microbotryum intermedium]|uniref:BQ2448_7540 protein n=1 Tax=Microbotryum intermedium TaxID=269621 RepID=A0A238FQN8_9BASI|nr:BQ2448_7540 [Microbotryum intermedium]
MSFSSTHANRINEVFNAGYAQLPNYPASAEDLEKAENITPGSVFELWSCTKLVTSIAAMQLVEKGTIGLDDDVAKYIPEVKDARVYKGLDKDGKVLTENTKSKVTIRMLLSHTAGLTYELTPAHAEAQRALDLPNVY